VAYFRRVEVKRDFAALDPWLRHKLRVLLWRQWRTLGTRVSELRKRGLSRREAERYADNGRGPWWNAGARHMNQAVPTHTLQQLGLVSFVQEHRRLARCS
jgi:RNA-directed DNA polymerase